MIQYKEHGMWFCSIFHVTTQSTSFSGGEGGRFHLAGVSQQFHSTHSFVFDGHSYHSGSCSVTVGAQRNSELLSGQWLISNPKSPLTQTALCTSTTFTKRILSVQYSNKTTATPKCIKKPLCHFMVSGYNRWDTILWINREHASSCFIWLTVIVKNYR